MAHKESKTHYYKADKFDGIIWIWDWVYNDLIKQYEAKNINPICPQSPCKNVTMKLGLENDFGKYYLCPNCQVNTTIPRAQLVWEDRILKRLDSN